MRPMTNTSQPAGGAVQSKGARRRARKRAVQSGGMTTLPVNVGQLQKYPGAQINGRAAHCVTVSHREYLMDVTSQTAFLVKAASSINPGLDPMFPWLGAMARKYEKYRFRQLTFHYEPTCSSATSGSVYMAVDYDVTDAVPTTKSEFISTSGCIKAQSWMYSKLPCNQQDMQEFVRERFTRGSNVTGIVNYQPYDLGRLLVATAGFDAGGTVGEIYVEYVVDLLTPQPNVVEETFENSSKILAGGLITKAAPLGTDPIVTGGIGVVPGIDHRTLTFNDVGEYLLEYSLLGTGFQAGTPTNNSTATAKTDLGWLPTAAGDQALYSAKAKVDVPGQTVNFDFSPLATTVTNLLARVSRYPYTL